jgi:hypothetical protein
VGFGDEEAAVAEAVGAELFSYNPADEVVVMEKGDRHCQFNPASICRRHHGRRSAELGDLLELLLAEGAPGRYLVGSGDGVVCGPR